VERVVFSPAPLHRSDDEAVALPGLEAQDGIGPASFPVHGGARINSGSLQKLGTSREAGFRPNIRRALGSTKPTFVE
jgi:hypothetical protein